MEVDVDQFDHPSWLTAVATGVGYALIIAVLTLALFVAPWALFTLV